MTTKHVMVFENEYGKYHVVGPYDTEAEAMADWIAYQQQGGTELDEGETWEDMYLNDDQVRLGELIAPPIANLD